MTAHKAAVAYGMAVLAMGAMNPARAFDDHQIVAVDPAVAIDGDLADALTDFDQHYDAILHDRLARVGGFSSGPGRGKQSRSPFKAYGGIGISKFKLSMDFDSGDVALRKDRGFDRPRVILGMGYRVTEDFSLGFEYRALAADQPLFSLDVGSETLNVDTRFTKHNVFLTGRYKF